MTTTDPPLGSGDTEDSVDSTAPTEHAGGDAGSMASLLREVAATGAAGGGDIEAGTVVGGQYRIERMLGAGGMGVVYLARDQRLHRPVAIKLGAARSAAALAQLQREAAALARLSHPNVVAVHQVGEHDGRVFIAMEYVAGGTARSWVTESPRTGREVVAMYAAAGDGLAAAHAAGMIHRDFKPDNLLVGSDGRPRIADFGLAQPAAAPDSAVPAERPGLAGTPAYMPPEQLAGDAIDARADQFAFCVSLWEALFGVRPYRGANARELANAIAAAPPSTGTGDAKRGGGGGAPTRRRVPRHIIDALRRGLAAERDRRWPDMAPLVAALRHDPAAVRRRVALVIGVALAATAIAVPLARRGRRAIDPCRDAPTILATTWNPTRAARIERALGHAAWAPVAARIDVYGRAWSLGHRDACRATRVARSQSENILARRMRCLELARGELGAVLDVLERGGPTIAAGAADAVAELPDLAACADVAALADQVPLPSDPETRARVIEADRLLAEAMAADIDPIALDSAGKAARALAAARAGGWKRQIAAALANQAGVVDDAGRAAEAGAMYREAAALALASRSDDLAALSLADLAWNLSDASDDSASLVLELAQALAERAHDTYVRRRVMGAAATVAQHQSRHDDAIAIRRQMMMLDDDPETASADWPSSDQYNLAAALVDAGRPAEAEPYAARAVELAIRDFGPAHAKVGSYLSMQAMTVRDQGRLDEASALAERGQAILEAAYGKDDVHLLEPLDWLGTLRNRQGRGDEARALWQRALAIARRTHSPMIPSIESELAIAMVGAGDLDGAAAASAEVVELLERRDGPDAGTLIDPLLVVGYVAREQGRIAEALAVLRRALALSESTVGSDHPATHNLRVELARTLVVAGHPDDARVMMERALAGTAARTDLDPLLIVDGHLVLAEAALATHDHARAVALTDTAARIATARGRPDLVATIATWRTAHL